MARRRNGRGRNSRRNCRGQIGCCVYCGREAALTVDHVIPLSRWVEFRIRRRVLDNNSNRVLACPSCNQEKGSMTPAEWFARHPEYRKHMLARARYLSDAVKQAVLGGA